MCVDHFIIVSYGKAFIFFHPVTPKSDKQFNECLKRNSSLQSLHVTDIIVRPPRHADDYCSHLPWLKTLLRSVLGAPHLRKVVLRIKISKALDASNWQEWKAIDDVFDGVALENLQVIIYDKTNDFVNKVDSLLPELQEKKVLVIRSQSLVQRV
jgi:hypothetical protein